MSRIATGRFRTKERLVQEIVRLRDKKGWAFTAIAKDTGVSDVTVGRYYREVKGITHVPRLFGGPDKKTEAWVLERVPSLGDMKQTEAVVTSEDELNAVSANAPTHADKEGATPGWKNTYLCLQCGSSDVWRITHDRWDFQQQKWVMHDGEIRCARCDSLAAEVEVPK